MLFRSWVCFAVIHQSVVVVAIGYGYWYWLMRRYQMNQIMPATLLVPPFGVLSGVIFLGESLTLTLIAGGLMTIVGVGIIILRRPKRSEEHTSELQSLMRISYAVFCLKKNKT